MVADIIASLPLLLPQAKQCFGCKKAKPLDQFPVRRQKRGKTGLFLYCKVCDAKQAKAKAELYKSRHPDGQRLATRRWRERHPERAKAMVRERQRSGKQREDKNRWARRNPERVALCNRISMGVRVALRRVGAHKLGPTFEVLGYDVATLRLHLERQFMKGMNWANIGKWHIDHIIPVSAFEFTSEDDPEFKAAWALSNLRPLWGPENVRKGRKRLTLL